MVKETLTYPFCSVMSDFEPNGFPYGNSMLFPSKLFYDKRAEDRKRLEEKRLEEKREEEKRFEDKRNEEARDEEKRAWDDLLEDKLRKRTDEDQKREIEKRHIRHFGHSPLDALEQAFLHKWFPAGNWKRAADSLGNARNGHMSFHDS